MNTRKLVQTRALRAVGVLMTACIAALSVAACGSSTDDRAVDLAAAPSGVRWVNYQGIAVPRSSESGPRSDVPAPRGYSRDPQGAILAIENGHVVVSLAPDGQYAQAYNTVLAYGPGRDNVSVARAFQRVSGAVPPDAALRFVGYRFLTYTDDLATASVVTARPGDGAMTATESTVAWMDGDWKLVLRDSSHPAPATAAVRLLTGYTTFGPP